MTIQPLKRQTKIVWSLEAGDVTPEAIETVQKIDPHAIRLVHIQGREKMASDIIGTLRAGDEPPALMVDFAAHSRALIAKIHRREELSYGERVVFVRAGEKEKGDVEIISDVWDELFVPDAQVYLGYGSAVLRVCDVKSKAVTAEVIQGGVATDEMEVHVPATRKLPDLKQLESSWKPYVKAGVDYLIVPPLSCEELIELQNHIQTQESACPFIILKVDSVAVAESLDKKLPLVDGVLISRREIALSTSPAAVPMITKEIIQKANDAAKLVVTASEMLASVRHNPTPTRAEVSDIANAVIDGTDAVVVSEEVARGKHPLRAMDIMKKIIEDVEHSGDAQPNWTKKQPVVQSEFDAVAFAAYRTARRLNAKAIVCVTHAGNTPMRLASFRAPIPILAVTFDEGVKRRLSLVRGVTTLVLEGSPALDEVLPLVNERLKRDSWLQAGDRIIFVSITLSSVGREASNLFTVQQLT